MANAPFLLACSGALAYLAYRADSATATVVLGWTAASAAVVAVAYARLVPSPFRKRADGRLDPVAALLLWPYLVGTWLVFHARIALSRAQPISEVHDGLLLGRRLATWEARRLAALGVRSVLDLTCEFSEPAAVRRGRDYLNVAVLDGVAPTPSELRRAVLWIDVHAPLGPLFVHCAAGHGRSAAVVAAHLFHTGVVTSVAEAADLVKTRRPGVRLRHQELHNIELFAAAEDGSSSSLPQSGRSDS